MKVCVTLSVGDVETIREAMRYLIAELRPESAVASVTGLAKRTTMAHIASVLARLKEAEDER